MKIPLAIVAVGALGLAPAALDDDRPSQSPDDPATATPMQLGAFSVSLAVKDLEASRAFYEQLGFSVFHGDAKQNWLILRNGDTVIGLFQGMFEQNILTFNPGWDQRAEDVESFTDVRDLQARLEAAGVTITTRADPDSDGPASFVLVDPDGNPILVDQHRARPGR